MATTPNLNITLLEQSQSQKEVTINEALLSFDAMFGGGVIDRDVADPTTLTPSEGDRYIVAASATDDWAGHDDDIAFYLDSAWRFVTPGAGMRVWVVDEAITVVFTGGAWVAEPSGLYTPNSASTAFAMLEEEITLTGPSTESTIEFPDRAIMLGAGSRTTEAITGATSYDVGIAGEANKFGGTLGIALGSNNAGVIGPTAVYAPTKVVITANGSDFTGGKVRIALHYIQCIPPQS